MLLTLETEEEKKMSVGICFTSVLCQLSLGTLDIDIILFIGTRGIE